MKKYMVFSIFLGLVFMPYTAFAEVTGLCANCHTMHASQTPWPGEWGDKSELPQAYLLATTGSTSPCVGCHSSATSSTFYDLDGCMVPVVLYTGGAAPSSYLAGGNFYWVKQGDDSKGHNVFLNEDDEDLIAGAPGDYTGLASCGTNPCHLNLSQPADMGMPELDGKYGCEGCHLNIRHHANDHANGESGLVGCEGSCTVEDANGWYRFLSGHFSGNNHGVRGYEDGNWEAGLHDGGDHQGEPQHNEYWGTEWSGGYGFGAFGNITTAFCPGCHSEFHEYQHQGDEIATNPWIRHPSDAVIIQDPANPGEYADAGGASHLYDPLSPVARPSLSDPPTNPGNIDPSTDMVMCLSCHRPHGSPYPDLLRWDYTTQLAGGGGDDKGCFYCHTQKND